jgi:hypothetical protein
VDLLPIYDEYLVAYRDRLAVPHLGHTFGSFLNALLIDGQVGGTWRSDVRGSGVSVDVRPVQRLKPPHRAALERAVARHRRFLEPAGAE